MHRYFIELVYNGSGYNGWQIQPNALCPRRNQQGTLPLVETGNQRPGPDEQTREYTPRFSWLTSRVMSPFLTRKPWQTNSIVSWEKTSRSKIYTPCCLICMLDFRLSRVRTNIISIKTRIRLLTRLPTDRTPYRTSG